MGNAILKNKKAFVPPLLDETRIFSLWSIDDVKELYKRFKSQVFGFALVEAQFESIIAFKPDVAQHCPLEKLFDILDNDNDGRVDGLELLGGLTLCCNAPFEAKARFCFELFDFNLNSVMSRKEMVIMMMSSVCGMNLLTGGGEDLEPEMEVFEALADDAIARADLNSDGQIDFNEFIYWARSNRELMAGLEALNRISQDAKNDIDPEDSAPETDDDDLSDADLDQKVRSAIEAEGVVVKTVKSGGIDTLLASAGRGDQNVSSGESAPWKSQIFEPTNFKRKKGSNEGPDTNLELTWAFGYKILNCRNTARFIGNPEGPQNIVYFTAALAIVYNPRLRTQSFYMGHTDAISCLTMHPSNQIVATADVKANIHIWSVDNDGVVTALSVMKGIVKEGMLHIAFSPTGDRIAAIGRDGDHTLTIHDVNSSEIISSAKGLVSPNTVFDMAYSPDGSDLVIVGKQEVKFYYGVHTDKRAIESGMGVIGSHGKRQTFFCCAYLSEEVVVVGCASGDLYRFSGGKCVDIVQAHGIREPVLSVFYNTLDGTLVTGGKDCLVKIWDTSLKPIGAPIDISEDVDGDGLADNGSLDCAILSLQQSGDQLLIGTRGSDIFQVGLPARPGEAHSMTRVAWGHAVGEIWGLAVHPVREEFATCGDDKTIRIWSVRSREQLNLRKMPDVSRSVAYSPNGEVICLGMLDGSMALMESSSPSLRVYSTWKHSTSIITDVKFSIDGTYIAAGSADGNIYLYKSQDKKEYQRQAVCRGHSGAITHLDFSIHTAQPYIQSNATDFALLFWDVEGNQVKNSSSLRDVTWATLTCTQSWPTQGIWSEGNDYTDINSCMALPDIGDIITGDDYHKVKLYKYPALKSGSLFQTYIGHSSHVTCVRFTSNKRYAISIGGADRTVLLWKHVIELDESDIEGAENSSSSSASASESGNSSNDDFGPNNINLKNEIADVGPRSLEQEAVNMGWTVQELKEYIQRRRGGGEGGGREFRKSAVSSNSSGTGDGSVTGKSAGNVAQWKSAIVEPSKWTPVLGSTDVDLDLAWVHGYRAHDCRNNVLYSAAGCIVYNTASLAVVHNKGSGKQQYLKGAHIDEVLGITSHPAGQIFATGEAGSRPMIVIWNSKDMQVLSRIEHAHERGVPLLAFNTKGNILASVGLDGDSALCLHEWMKGVQILRTPTDKNRVLCCCFLANNSAQSTAGTTSALAAMTAAAGGGGRGVALSQQQQVPGLSSDDGKAGIGKDVVVTAGVKHIKFWWYQGQNVQSQRALWGAEFKEKQSTIMCVASASNNICVTGSDKGVLIIWQNFKAVCNVSKFISAGGVVHPDDIELNPAAAPDSAEANAVDHDLRQQDVDYPHKGAISCIWAIPGAIAGDREDIEHCLEGYQESARYITGDRNGVVAIWRMVQTMSGNLRLLLMKSFHISQLKPRPLDSGVRSICERDGMLLIGVNSSEIFEVSEAKFPFLITPRPPIGLVPALTGDTMRASPSPYRSSKRMISANSFLESVEDETTFRQTRISAQRLNVGHSTGEVWGLAMHPFLPIFLTGGDDSTIKCWSLQTHRLVSYISLPDKCRSVDIRAPTADSFALSLNSGMIWVIKLEVMLNPDQKPSFRNHVDPHVDGRDVTPLLDIQDVDERMSLSSAAEDSDTSSGSAGQSNNDNNKSDQRVSDETKGIAMDAASIKSAGKEEDGYFFPHFVTGPTRWVHVLKYSFDGSLLAAGCDDKIIYLFNVNNDYSLLCKLEGHSSFVTHLDFGLLLKSGHETNSEKLKLSDGSTGTRVTRITQKFDKDAGKLRTAQQVITKTALQQIVQAEAKELPQRDITPEEIYMQSTSGAGELLFWCCNGELISSAAALKNVWWATLSCPYGWPVQGVWPADSAGSEINAVARSNLWDKVPVLATVDIFGRVRLYNYPCVDAGAADKTYKGHASNVTNVQFSFDDEYCVTLGSNDKCVFIWQTDIQDEIREREAYAAAGGQGGTGTDLDTIVEEMNGDVDGMIDGDDSNDGNNGDENIDEDDGADDGDEGFSVLKTAPTEGDQAGAVKPWKGSVREPSNWVEPSDVTLPPQASLDMKFAYGYRGWDCRNNINFADSRFELVYHIGATGIVLNTAEQKQLHNTEHDDDILCLAVHPEGHTVATGEIGKFPKIVLWDANTGVTVRVITFHKRGVSNIAFSGCGQILVSTGMDDDRTVAVHNAATGAVLGKGKAGRGVEVYALSVGGSEIFVTGGKNHIKFWELPNANSPGGELSSKTGIYNIKSVKVRTVVSTAFLGSDVVSGMVDGSLLMWKERSCTKVCKAHTGPVTAMFTISNSTPGIDSREHGPRIITGGKDGFVFIWDLQFRQVWSLNMNETSPLSTCPQIQAVATKENRLIIGTKAAEIYEVSLLSDTEVFRLVQGHFSNRAELWGLDCHPSMHRFVTGCDDMTVRVWDGKAMQQIHIAQVGSKVRSVCYYPDGSRIAAATYDGKVIILSSNLETIEEETTVCNQWISVIKYSPNGRLLAVGSHDGIIYVLETKSYSVRCKCKGHHSYITALDFSSDSNLLQSNSGDYELLFWNCANGKQIASPSEVRDVHWATFTCSLGWPVQGIWAPHQDGTDINAVDRSPDGRLLVTGDDNCIVKLFRYPCPKERAQFRDYKGHAEHVMRVRFSYDGKYVFSAGGLDKSIIQFEVLNETSVGKKKKA